MISQRKNIGQFLNAAHLKMAEKTKQQKISDFGDPKSDVVERVHVCYYVMCSCPSEHSFDKISSPNEYRLVGNFVKANVQKWQLRYCCDNM